MSYVPPVNIYQQLGHIQPTTAVHPQYQTQGRPPPVARSAYQHQHQQQQQQPAPGYGRQNARARPVSMPAQPSGRPLPDQPPSATSTLKQFAPPPLHPVQSRQKLPNQPAPQSHQQQIQRSYPQPAQASPDRSPSPYHNHSPQSSYSGHPGGGYSPQQSYSGHSPQGSYQGHPPQRSYGGHSPQPPQAQARSPQPPQALARSPQLPPQAQARPPPNPPQARGRSNTYDSNRQGIQGQALHQQWQSPQQWSQPPQQPPVQPPYQQQRPVSYQQQPTYRPPSTQAPPSPQPHYQQPSQPHPQSHRSVSPQPNYAPTHGRPDPSPTRGAYVIHERVASPNPPAELVRKYSKKGRSSPVRFSTLESTQRQGPPQGLPQPPAAQRGFSQPPPPPPPRTLPANPVANVIPSLPEVDDPKRFVPLYKRSVTSSAHGAPIRSAMPSEMRTAAVSEPIPMSHASSSGSGRPLPSTPGRGPGPMAAPLPPSFSPKKQAMQLPPPLPPSLAGQNGSNHGLGLAESNRILNRSDTTSTSSSTRSNGSMHRRERAILSESDDSEVESVPSPGFGIRDLPSHSAHRQDSRTSPEPPSPGFGIRDLPSRAANGSQSANLPFGALRPGWEQTGLPEPPMMTRTYAESGWKGQGGAGGNYQSDSEEEEQEEQQEDYRRPTGTGGSQTLRFAAMSVDQAASTSRTKQDTTPKRSRQPPAPLMTRQFQSTPGAQFGGSGGEVWPSNLPQLPRAPGVAGSTSEPTKRRSVPQTPTSPKTMSKAQFANGATSPRSPRFQSLDLEQELNSAPPRSGFSPKPLPESPRMPPEQNWPSGFQAPQVQPASSSHAWETQRHRDDRQAPAVREYQPSPPQPQARQIQRSPAQNGVMTHTPHQESRGRPHHAQSHPPPVVIESPAPLGGREQTIQLNKWDSTQDVHQQSPQQHQPPQLQQFAKPQPPSHRRNGSRPTSRALPQPGQPQQRPSHVRTSSEASGGGRSLPQSPHQSQPPTPKVQIFEVPGISVSSSPSSPSVPSISIDGGGGGPPSINVSSDIPSINIGGDDGIPSINIGGGEASSGPPVNKANPHNRPPIQRYPGLRCGLCRGHIVGRMVDAMGVRWHPDCFRCTVCDESLEHVSSYEHDGRPYCHLDYHENFAPRCFHCETAILESRFISIDDDALGGKRTYHENHFFCAECGDPFLEQARKSSGLLRSTEGELTLSEGSFEGFTVHHGHPYCEACHIRLRNPKCKKCKRAIRDGDDAVEALGAKWCKSCFCCAGCERIFEDPSFYERDKQAWCAHCFSIILRNEV